MSVSPLHRLRRAEIAYWLLPPLLVGVQALWIVRTARILRFEEVAEGARSAWWLGQHTLFDGISTNVGWYGPLLAAYELFGFSPATARWLKLGLYGGAMLCLAWVLRRPWGGRGGYGAARMGPGRAAVPLLAVGLSPTVLLFGTVGTSFGTDLLYLPYLLAILAGLRAGADRGWADGLLRFAFGAVVMLAWTSYPVFLFYLPALALAYATTPAPEGGSAPLPRLPGLSLRSLVPALAGFLLPVVAAAAWLARPARLFHDPATGSGLFRGGGTGFDLDPMAIARHVGVALQDLFVRGTSYYYWVERPDLAGPLGIAAFLAVAAGSVVLWRRNGGAEGRGSRLWLAAAWLLPAVNLLVVSAGTGPQGLRRATSLLAGFYILYAWVWRTLTAAPWRPAVGGGLLAGPGYGARVERPGRFAAVFLLLLPVHHLVSAAEQYPRLPLAGSEQTHLWLRVRPSAEASLRYWLDRTAAGEPLDCRDLGLEPERCRYSGIYALLSGHREWNGLPPVALRGWDPETGRYVELSVERLSGEFSGREPD